MLKKIIFAVVIIILAVTVTGIIIFKNMAKRFDAYMSALRIENVDFTAIPDGIYHGRSETGVITVELETEVVKGRVVSVNILEHRSGRGGPAESIVDRVIAEQSLAVDTVSGATLSSLVILDTIEKSLVSGPIH